MAHSRADTIFEAAASGALPQDPQGLPVISPCDGEPIAQLPMDTASGVDAKAKRARAAQAAWSGLARSERIAALECLAEAIRQQREPLAQMITLDSGKTAKEALGEVDGSSDILLKTIKDASLPEFNGMLRRKERPPLGVVGLITSFNFPLVVAGWTLAPALLAGNAVLWKPSEKTPLVAWAYKAIFDKAMGEHADTLHILIGGRNIGEALVAHEGVDMISATGSVAMGKGIKAALARKKNNAIKPILELGGNNAVIISDKITPQHLEWSISALLHSFFGTSGQRCTNTRRLIVHRQLYLHTETLLKRQVEAFIQSGAIQNPLSGASNDYGYGPLIDRDAYERFECAKSRVQEEGGTVLFGRRLLEAQYKEAYYVEPALALLPQQMPIMLEETFAPLLFLVPYEGNIDHAIALANAPANAGLVNGMYTQNQAEADRFAALNQAGHSVINSPKGTGTPAFGMGFGGNKDSGEGEILNSADPLRPFVRDTTYHRIAQNKDIPMDFA